MKNTDTIVQNAGQSAAESETPKTLMIENYLRSTYLFRYNVVKGKFEYTTAGLSQWQPVDRILINSIRRQLNNTGSSLRCSREQMESIIESDFSPSVNPIREYFSSLIVRNGTENINRLLSTVKVSNEQMWSLCMTKWLVAVVANALEDRRCCNHTCLVMAGAQGIGKTTWLNHLCPKSLVNEYLYIGKFNPDSKDSLRLVSERLLINIDDQLQNINRADEDKIKAILTQNTVSYRKPYDVNIIDCPHRASFMASVNSSEYLTDSTGSRRFLSFNVENAGARLHPVLNDMTKSNGMGQCVLLPEVQTEERFLEKLIGPEQRRRIQSIQRQPIFYQAKKANS